MAKSTTPKKRRKKPEQDNADQRLLDAGLKLFAEYGVDNTTIRDLIDEAKCNQSAVNYHYGSKEKLYEKLMLHHMDAIVKVRLDTGRKFLAKKRKFSIEDFLQAFADAFFAPLKDPEHARRILILLHREMTHPRLDPELFMQHFITPQVEMFTKIFDKMCPALTETQIFLCVHSFIAQLVHIANMRNLYSKLPMHTDQPDVDMIGHVIRFTAAGIRACEKGDV